MFAGPEKRRFVIDFFLSSHGRSTCWLVLWVIWIGKMMSHKSWSFVPRRFEPLSDQMFDCDWHIDWHIPIVIARPEVHAFIASQPQPCLTAIDTLLSWSQDSTCWAGRTINLAITSSTITSEALWRTSLKQIEPNEFDSRHICFWITCRINKD